MGVFNIEMTQYRKIESLRVKGKLSAEPPSPVDLVRGNLIPQLIDELPLLAVVGTQVPGGIEIRDAAELGARRVTALTSR